MLSGYVKGTHTITAEIVSECADELRIERKKLSGKSRCAKKRAQKGHTQTKDQTQAKAKA